MRLDFTYFVLINSWYIMTDMSSLENPSKCLQTGCPFNNNGHTLNSVLARLASTSLEVNNCIAKQGNGNNETEARRSAIQTRLEAIQCIRYQNS